MLLRPRQSITKKKKEEEAPKLLSVSSSLDSAVEKTRVDHDRWKDAYTPAPLVSQSTILVMGVLVFVVACLWPPLILLLAYMASKAIPYTFRENDSATRRRQLCHEFYTSAAHHPSQFTNIPSHIQFEESYWKNERGMLLCTWTMTPKQKAKAVACFCHGYTDNMSYYKKVEFQRLVEAGIAVVTIEYEGHGRSDGPLALIADWNVMIDDVATYYQQVIASRFADMPIFLMGESMGGAVAYSVYNKLPNLFRGVVFICPMCKISDDMLPPNFVIGMLTWLIGSFSWLGYLPMAPARNDLYNVTYKLPHKLQVVSRCPTSFGRNPRLATARELIAVTRQISDNLGEFAAPFLVVHGQADRVTDPKLSQALYEQAQSTDKTCIIYEGMWHSLTCGEPDDNIDKVFGDVIAWILERA